MNLIVQTVDRRMNGYNQYKYRVKFEPTAEDYRTRYQTYEQRIELTKRINLAYMNCCEHMTKAYGYGPDIRFSYLVKDTTGSYPAWATRTAYKALNTSAPDTIYIRDDESLAELEKILSFYVLTR